MQKCGLARQAKPATMLRPMRHVSDTTKLFSATALAALSYESAADGRNSQATDRSAEIQLTPSAVIGKVARASPAWGEEFYAHG